MVSAAAKELAQPSDSAFTRRKFPGWGWMEDSRLDALAAMVLHFLGHAKRHWEAPFTEDELLRDAEECADRCLPKVLKHHWVPTELWELMKALGDDYVVLIQDGPVRTFAMTEQFRLEMFRLCIYGGW